MYICLNQDSQDSRIYKIEKQEDEKMGIGFSLQRSDMSIEG